ncbi:MAG: hypothetical protein ACR2I5_11345 [Candidatus Limnocylindria bacterium]
MSETPVLVYLEADDEITAVIRRIREADPGRVVIVAPGRSRATSSVVALRLLAREDREVAIVGDALTRSLAAEAAVPAYATVDEARRAEPGPSASASESRHAAIHVIRGPTTDETAPTMAAVAGTDVTRGAETRQVTMARSRHMARPRRVRRALPVALLVAAGLVVIAAGVAGAVILPAATITLSPRSEAVEPRTYRLEIDDPERLGGTVESTQIVAATGDYSVLEPARGTVIFLNWDNVPVEVGAGSLVAAGEQAFETVDTVVVPGGELTAEGTIQAGEAPVGVVASLAGPAANVSVGAINTVLNQGTEAQLRGFPNNDRRLVTNPEATSGGIDETGPEITQEDLDAAITALRDDLDGQVADALEPEQGTILVTGEAADPAINGVEDVVGTRDQATVEITGTLAWEAYAVEETRLTDDALERFAADSSARPDGHELLPDATLVEIGEATLAGTRMTVEVEVSGRSATTPESSDVIELAAGRTAEDARAAMRELGDATIDLWPGWVGTVPEIEWRIDVLISGEPAP